MVKNAKRLLAILTLLTIVICLSSCVYHDSNLGDNGSVKARVEISSLSTSLPNDVLLTLRNIDTGKTYGVAFTKENHGVRVIRIPEGEYAVDSIKVRDPSLKAEAVWMVETFDENGDSGTILTSDKTFDILTEGTVSIPIRITNDSMSLRSIIISNIFPISALIVLGLAYVITKAKNK